MVEKIGVLLIIFGLLATAELFDRASIAYLATHPDEMTSDIASCDRGDRLMEAVGICLMVREFVFLENTNSHRH